MRKGERSKLQIIQTAAAMFLEKGYDNTTVEDILNHLKLSKGSFYYHFESKLEVLTQIAALRVEDARRQYDEALPTNSLDRFDRLLYFASPLRPSETGLLRSLIQLSRVREGALLFDAFNRAAFNAFYKEYDFLLTQLTRENQADVNSDKARQLAFESFLTGCRMQISQAANLPLEKFIPAAVQLIQAQRQQLEEALGLSPGVLLIHHAQEMLAALKSALCLPEPA